MMEQLEVGVCFISESWDRDSLSLEEVIKIDGYRVIKNVLQRKGKGGKLALVISESNYWSERSACDCTATGLVLADFLVSNYIVYKLPYPNKPLSSIEPIGASAPCYCVGRGLTN